MYMWRSLPSSFRPDRVNLKSKGTGQLNFGSLTSGYDGEYVIIITQEEIETERKIINLVTFDTLLLYIKFYLCACKSMYASAHKTYPGFGKSKTLIIFKDLS